MNGVHTLVFVQSRTSSRGKTFVPEVTEGRTLLVTTQVSGELKKFSSLANISSYLHVKIASL